jgi:hypothetical protein
VLYALLIAINLPTFHLDGAFQTASSLYRLDAGQLPGKDFFPYLGIGPVFTLFPLFKIFGSDLAASGISSEIITLIASTLCTALIWHLIFRPKAFVTSLTCTCWLFLAPIVIYNFLALDTSIFSRVPYYPGNSLRPLRSFAPYFVMLIYYFFISNLFSTVKKYIFSGLLCGAIFIWSNDFAIPTALSFALLIFLSSINSKELTLKNATLFSLSAFFSVSILYFLATFGHILPLLKYNFQDVRIDQWWFFNPYDAGSRFLSISDAGKIFARVNLYSLGIFILLPISYIFFRKKEILLLAWIGFVLFLGGILASIGGHIEEGYFVAFDFFGLLIIFIGAMKFTYVFLKRLFPADSWLISKLPTYLLAFLSILVVVHMAWKYNFELTAAQTDPKRFYVSELGGFLGREWESYISLARNTNSSNTLEEYWGIWSATRKTFPAWPVDSAIHALGSTRNAAEAAISTADTITTTRSVYSIWQSWSIGQNYWLYKHLLKDWSPSFLSPSTIVWTKNNISRIYPQYTCNAVNEKKLLEFEDIDAGFYEIEINYDFSNSGRIIAMMKNNISFIGGYMSIDPYAKKAIFPAYFSENGKNTLDTYFIGNLSDTATISSCIAKKITFEDTEVLHVVVGKQIKMTDDFFITDNNWIKGIAKNWAGFYVANTPEISDNFKVGQFVIFKNSEVQRITKVEVFHEYLNVYLDGSILNADTAGYPNKFITESFFLTDKSWINGIAVNRAGFFLPNLEKFRAEYKVGRVVTLPSGDRRKITEVVLAGEYLNIYLEGAPLDGKIGPPIGFKVSD